MIDVLKDRNTAELLFFGREYWYRPSEYCYPPSRFGQSCTLKSRSCTLGAQLAEAKRYSEIIANQAQATLLLNLVDKWNSEEMLASRRLFRARHSEIKQSINDQHRSLNDQQCTTKVNESFNALLGNLYDNDLVGDYLILMRMMGFFETVGLLVRKGYIDGLFRGPILQSVAAFELHIEIRQKEKGTRQAYAKTPFSSFSRSERFCPKR